MNRRPDFLIVCDHGNRGGPLDYVATLPWFRDRPGWWVADAVDPHVRLWLMEDDRRGWEPWRVVSDPYPADLSTDPRREALEIPCPKARCTRRAYRTDGDRLQVLLAMIADDERFASVVVSRDDSRIVVALDTLHTTRREARRHGLPV